MIKRTHIIAALIGASSLAGFTPSIAQTSSEKLAALNERITRLEDMNAIETLQRSYG